MPLNVCLRGLAHKQPISPSSMLVPGISSASALRTVLWGRVPGSMFIGFFGSRVSTARDMVTRTNNNRSNEMGEEWCVVFHGSRAAVFSGAGHALQRVRQYGRMTVTGRVYRALLLKRSIRLFQPLLCCTYYAMCRLGSLFLYVD